MARSLAGGDELPGLIRNDGLQKGYRFGRIHVRRVRVRTALSRVSGRLKELIEAVADAKLRRMERELELRGAGFVRVEESLVARQSASTARPRGSRWEK
ncbi:hypothetical protein SAMN05444159_6834 [Bradyrhizobium lablabi]|uniref:Uncharacterized protein n=1 Tax=Bradyrhizobium lablabi TaxID=722472 RepID=A0A1M7DJJ4_9BRAD|nr:hypothetical protein [Bradyrhizobium lablabi]SHL79349.1 hypothetical protein SAMN05444159_6834 [Bradyrhizobium lablabi]